MLKISGPIIGHRVSVIYIYTFFFGCGLALALGGQLLSPRDINTNGVRRQNPVGTDSRRNSNVSEDITQGAKPLHKDLDRWISGVAGHHSLLGISSEYSEHSHCAKSGLGSSGLFGVYHKWSQGA